MKKLIMATLLVLSNLEVNASLIQFDHIEGVNSNSLKVHVNFASDDIKYGGLFAQSEYYGKDGILTFGFMNGETRVSYDLDWYYHINSLGEHMTRIESDNKYGAQIRGDVLGYGFWWRDNDGNRFNSDGMNTAWLGDVLRVWNNDATFIIEGVSQLPEEEPIADVPEPATLMLFGGAMFGLLFSTSRKHKA